MKRLSTLSALFFLMGFTFLQAQDTPPPTDDPDPEGKEEKEEFTFEIEEGAKPTIELNPGKVEEEPKKKKEKKRKKNVFYGIKTKKRYTKTRKGRNTTIEVFYVMKGYEKPNKYMAEKYYFDINKKEIVKSAYSHKKFGMPLHGTYKKMVNGKIVLQGIFYKGGKHGRWEQFGRNEVLVDKKKFYQGFPKEAEISYYDSKMEKVKEVVPLHYDKKDGMYLKYYESGRIMEKGMYRENEKVGRWNEFYDKQKRNRKRETQHRKRPFDDEFKSYVVREWDEKGKQTVNNSKNSRKKGRGF